VHGEIDFPMMDSTKKAVRDFWSNASCGEELYLDTSSVQNYETQATIRYQLEPYIKEFASFDDWTDKKVLEIGVGLGADHQRFAEAHAELYGIDLTQRAIEHTRTRLWMLKLKSKLQVGDAECLPFPDDCFDLVYSWGVLHHSPNTAGAIAEVHRVLKCGGTAKIMIYHKYSIVGAMLWIRYSLLALKPTMSLAKVFAQYMESPGTKAYSVSEAQRLFAEFTSTSIRTVLTHGDLLDSDAGQRHRGILLTVARAIWPRMIIRRFLSKRGLFMLVTATK
jgi:ubiquinone/menaquinone biosynthesis C-methylase UbiE